MPTAIAWTRLKNGHIGAAKPFIFLTEWWCETVGWLAAILNLVLAYNMINGYDWENEDDELDEDGSKWARDVGYYIIVEEIIGWAVHYVYKHDAINYARYLHNTDRGNNLGDF